MQRSSCRSKATLASAALAGLALPRQGDAAFISEPPDFSDDPGAPTDLRSGPDIVDLSVVGDGVAGQTSGNIASADDDYALILAPAGSPVDIEIVLDYDAADGNVLFELYDGTDFSSTQLFSQSYSFFTNGSDTINTTITSTTGTVGVLARTNSNENFSTLDYQLQSVPEPSTAALLGLAAATALVGKKLARRADRAD